MKGERRMGRATKQENSYFHSFLLLLTATIWGVAFVAQSVGMDHVGPLTFVAARSTVAVVALVPVVLLFSRRAKHSSKPKPACDRRTFWTGGLLCGVLLFLGMITQQIGLVYTTVGKAGFITTTYVVLVPLLGIFLGRRIGLRMWIAVLLALAVIWRSNGGVLSAHYNVTTTDGRIAYLQALGWEADPVTETAQEIVIPRVFSGVFSDYNALQKQQGFDLSTYAGETCTAYTYRVTNYEGSTDTVLAQLFVYRNRVIGGDIHATAMDGFMHGLR